MILISFRDSFIYGWNILIENSVTPGEFREQAKKIFGVAGEIGSLEQRSGVSRTSWANESFYRE